MVQHRSFRFRYSWIPPRKRKVREVKNELRSVSGWHPNGARTVVSSWVLSTPRAIVPGLGAGDMVRSMRQKNRRCLRGYRHIHPNKEGVCAGVKSFVEAWTLEEIVPSVGFWTEDVPAGGKCRGLLRETSQPLPKTS